MNKTRSWFCDSKSDSSEDEKVNYENWEGVTIRDKNREKKDRQSRARTKLQTEMAKKASLMVGIGPVTRGSIEHFKKFNNNFEDAKIEAVREFLTFYLKYSSGEAEELEISATQLAPKDHIIYVAFNSHKDVCEIYSRVPRCKHPDVMTRNFVPPQYFEQYMFISRRLEDMRNEDKDIKTQMRFSKNGIKVFTKKKSQMEPFKNIPLEEICSLEELPKFDLEIRWRKKYDDPKRLDLSPARGKPPSMEQQQQPRPVHSMSRQHSTGSSDSLPRKKQKTTDNQSEYMSSKNVETQSMSCDEV